MTPTRFRGTCHFCNSELDTREPGVHQYTHGWVMNRAGGGGHGISLPIRDLKWAHRYCINRQVKGSFGQTALFDDKRKPEEQPPPPPADPGQTNAAFDERGMLVHVCNTCGADASFGVGVAIRKGDLGLWYCRAHRPVYPEFLDT